MKKFLLLTCMLAAIPAYSAPVQPKTKTPNTGLVPTASSKPAPIKIGIVNAATAAGLKGADYLKFIQRLQTLAEAQGIVLITDENSVLYKSANQQGYVLINLNPDIKDLLPSQDQVRQQKESVAKLATQNKDREAIKLALKSLNKLTSAVKSGVARQSYFDRVADVRAEVDEQLAEITDDDAKTKIQEIMQAYEDAGDWWNEAFRLTYAEVFIKSESQQELIKKYNLDVEKPGEFEKIFASSYTSFKYISSPLSQIWTAARVKVESLTQTLKESDTPK